MSYKFRYESELTEHSKAGQVIAQQHADLSSLRERLQLAEADLQQSEQALQETQEKLKDIEERLVAEQQKRLELQQKADLAIEAHMGSSQLEREAREAQERRAQEAAEEAERVRQEERDQRERIQREAEAEKERIAREAQEERERIARETQEERERIAKEAQAEREERERREQEAQEERARREQEMEVAKKQTQAEKEQAEALLKKRCQKAVRDEIARLVLVHRQALREDALDAAMSVEARDRAKSEGRSHCSICGKQTNVKVSLPDSPPQSDPSYQENITNHPSSLLHRLSSTISSAAKANATSPATTTSSAKKPRVSTAMMLVRKTDTSHQKALSANYLSLRSRAKSYNRSAARSGHPSFGIHVSTGQRTRIGILRMRIGIVKGKKKSSKTRVPPRQRARNR